MNDFPIYLSKMFEKYRSLRVSEKFWEIYKPLLYNKCILNCLSKFIDLRIVEQNPDEDWEWVCFALNPNITWDFIKDKITEDWGTWQISSNPCVNLEIVKQTPDFEWDWDCISANPSVTLETIKNNPDEPWSFGGISENPNLTFEFVLDNLDKDWNWEVLSKKLKLKEVLAVLPEINWRYLSYNKDITFEFVCKNLHRDWNWYGLYANSKVFDGKSSIDSIKHLIPGYKESSFWSGFSSNESVTIDIVLENPDENWNWYDLSKNPGIKLQDIKDHPELNWKECSIFFNPAFDEKELKGCIEKFKKYDACYDIPKKVSEDFEFEIKREWLAATKIKNWYFK